MPAQFSLAVYAPAEMEKMDALAAKTVPVSTLMEAAGRAVARAVMQRFKPCRVVVLCGPGNNGGDGYVAARYLQQAGWPVAVAALAPPKAGSPAEQAAMRFTGVNVPFVVADVQRAGLVIDAVLGAGLSRPVEGAVAAVLAAAPCVVAVDVPSGVDGATGQILGAAVKAALTVTFVRFKPGHLLYPARDYMGALVLADIGMPATALRQCPPQVWQNAPGLWRLPVPGPESHKYTRGVVSICAGGTMPGAARLCAAGARAVGAGLVRLAAGVAAPAYRLAEPGLVVDENPLPDLLEDNRRKVWVCGPGLTEAEVQAALPALMAAQKTILADAGALSAFSGRPEALKGVAVITPHLGEFTKLFGSPVANPIKAVRAAAQLVGAVVVLKGASTLIAAPDGRLAINDHATPALGTAGSGDTLSGIIAALLAAGMPAWEAAAAGVWLHGEAGMQAGPWPIAENLEAYLGAARVKATQAQKKIIKDNANSILPRGSL